MAEDPHSKLPADKRDARAPQAAKSNDVAAFLKAANATPTSSGQGGLIFALDATMSRQHTWDVATHQQGRMFDAVASVGNLSVQLVYFRGMGECRASRWVNDTNALRDLMTGISCRGGRTQISKVLQHARKQVGKADGAIKPSALVFVGDAMEENPDDLCTIAGELGLLKLPIFAFQEGADPLSEATFREIARLSGGAFARFDTNSADRLIELLSAVARFAAGGRAALADGRSREAKGLLEQLK